MKRSSVVVIGVSSVLLVGLAPRVCSAAAPAGEETRESPVNEARTTQTVRHWYGWQIFASDGVAGGLFLGAVTNDHDSSLFGVSALTFALGAPTIHLAHGHWDLALGSLGLRIMGPLFGAVLGGSYDIHTSSDDSGPQDSSSKWTTTGVAIGCLVASAIDGLVLAYDIRPSTTGRSRNQLLNLQTFPQLIVLRHELGLGYSARF